MAEQMRRMLSSGFTISLHTMSTNCSDPNPRSVFKQCESYMISSPTEKKTWFRLGILFFGVVSGEGIRNTLRTP